MAAVSGAATGPAAGSSRAAADTTGPAAQAPASGDAKAADTSLRGRLRRWWLNRHAPTDTLTLTQRNVYILPTRAGLAFAATLVLMLLASINYQLSLGYVLTFLLAGAGLVSMHLTHGTLRGLTLRIRTGTTGFAGQLAGLEVLLSSPDSLRHAVAVHFQDRRASGPSFAWADVPALGQASARLGFVPDRRGWHTVPPIMVSTSFPFGLFRAWAVWRPAARVLAWPKPELPPPALPAASPAAGESATTAPQRGSEFEGVRAWRRGDGLRQVLWKKMARTGELVSRETATRGDRELWLDWQAVRLPASDVEARIGRLTAWVIAAEREGLRYGLRMPGRELPLGQGELQRRAALEALALWP